MSWTTFFKKKNELDYHAISIATENKVWCGSVTILMVFFFERELFQWYLFITENLYGALISNNTNIYKRNRYIKNRSRTKTKQKNSLYS